MWNCASLTPGILDLPQHVILSAIFTVVIFHSATQQDIKEGNLRFCFPLCFHGHRFIILYEKSKSVTLIKSVLGATLLTALTNAVK